MKTIVTFIVIFLATFSLMANGNNAETTDSKENKASEKNTEIIEKKAVEPSTTAPNMNNDQWHTPNKRFRISKDFEGMLPLITYKEQQTA